MRWFLVTLLLGSVLATPGWAQQGVVVEEVWSRAQIAGRNGVVYLTLTAKGSADRLTGASSPLADRVELHESSMDQGVMKMREVPALVIPAGAKVTLAPGGLHIMLVGLRRALNEGDAVPLRLVFEKTGAVEVTAHVTKAGAAAHRHHQHR